MSRSTYIFSSQEDYDDAKQHLRNNMPSDSSDDDKIWFRDSWGYLEIRIEDKCSDPEFAASICREHRGRYKAD